jgi:hypothetical protein
MAFVYSGMKAKQLGRVGKEHTQAEETYRKWNLFFEKENNKDETCVLY